MQCCRTRANPKTPGARETRIVGRLRHLVLLPKQSLLLLLANMEDLLFPNRAALDGDRKE